MDFTKIEKIAPDYWRSSQLSIAKYYGAANINGIKFILDPDTDYLVREDVWKQELKDKKKAARVAKAEKRKWEAVAQSELFSAVKSEIPGFFR